MVHIAINPMLARIGPIALSWYMITVVLALTLSLVALSYEARRSDLSVDRVQVGALWAIACGLLGARLFHVLDHLDFYLNAPGALFALQEGGGAVWGAIVFGIWAGASYARRAKLAPWRTFDTAAPAAMLGLACGRLGSLINGEAWGAPTNVPWALVYDRRDALLPAALVGVPTHPYPVYELLWNLAIFAALWAWRGRAPRDGARFLVTIVLYALGRFALGFVRQEPLAALGLQQAQLVSLLVLCVATPLLLRRLRHSERQPAL